VGSEEVEAEATTTLGRVLVGEWVFRLGAEFVGVVADMRVLGIDPGTGRMGWAFVEGNRVRQALVACGCVETEAGLSSSRRLEILFDALGKLIEEYGPDEAAVEEIYFFKNAKTVIRVSEARGVVILGLTKYQLPVFDYTPLQVKQAVTGYGRAEKKQVQMMVKSILKLDTVPKPDDAADAVAVALTHFFTNIDLI
jgi:crossover junction endodeoxyribonuclease RuvC